MDARQWRDSRELTNCFLWTQYPTHCPLRSGHLVHVQSVRCLFQCSHERWGNHFKLQHCFMAKDFGATIVLVFLGQIGRTFPTSTHPDPPCQEDGQRQAWWISSYVAKINFFFFFFKHLPFCIWFVYFSGLLGREPGPPCSFLTYQSVSPSPSPYCCWGGHYLLSNQCLAEAQAEDGWVCRLFLSREPRMLF